MHLVRLHIGLAHTLLLLLNASGDGNHAFAKLGLSAPQAIEGFIEVLEFVVELFLDLHELLRGKACKVDWRA